MTDGLRITFAFNPDRPFFDRVFTRFAKDISDLTPAFREIAAGFYEGERRQFESQGGYGGQAWAPLSPAYAAWKAQHYPNKGILYRTDALFHAATGDPAAGAKMEIKPMSLVLGIEAHSEVANRARYHQLGTRRMPARPWLVVTDDMKRSWTRAIARELQAATARMATTIGSRTAGA